MLLCTKKYSRYILKISMSSVPSLFPGRHVGIPSLRLKRRHAGVTVYRQITNKKYSKDISSHKDISIFLKIHFSQIFETNIRQIYSVEISMSSVPSLFHGRHVGIPSLRLKRRHAGVTLYRHITNNKYSKDISSHKDISIFLKIHFSQIFETNIRQIYSEEVFMTSVPSLFHGRHVGIPSLRLKRRHAGATLYRHITNNKYSKHIIAVCHYYFFVSAFRHSDCTAEMPVIYYTGKKE